MFKRRLIGAHRMALILSSGKNPEGMCACHHCDNPPCCNPLHLFWGTDQDNAADRGSKGRARGAPAKIDIPRLLELRSQGASYSKLAAIFSVNQGSIGKALKRAALRAKAASL
jgi:hypothetical protein